MKRPWPASDAIEEQATFVSEADKPLLAAHEKQAKRLDRWAVRENWRRKQLAPGAWIYVAAASVELMLLGLQAANVPGHWWGQHGDHTFLNYVVAGVGALGVLLSAVLAHAYASLRQARQNDRRLEELARSIARQVRDIGRIGIDEISVHIWQLRDPRLWYWPRRFRWRGTPWHARHLARRAAFVTERREHEAIAFMEGVGVVGRCWAREREVVEDLSPILAQATDAATYYKAFGYDQRYRLSFGQLWNTRHFYAIWAYPIFLGPPGGQSFGGCVSVDVRCPHRAARLRTVADNRSQELDSLLADCAALLRDETPAN